MRFDICTLFPEIFTGFLASTIVGRAREQGLVESNLVNFRQFATDKHHTVDDTPFGGGAGMVLKPEPLFAAVEKLSSESKATPHVILLTPQGMPFTQQKAQELATKEHIILICGRYEGCDERVAEHLATEELSIGDYVLTGGEVPAMVIIESVARLLEGVLGNERSNQTDSFAQGSNLLGYPQYTKPRSYLGMDVPEVLLSGDHARIQKWREAQALERTRVRRPDLFKN